MYFVLFLRLSHAPNTKGTKYKVRAGCIVKSFGKYHKHADAYSTEKFAEKILYCVLRKKLATLINTRLNLLSFYPYTLKII